MLDSLATSAKKYFEEAKEMLKEKDLIEFVSKISIAELLSNNDKEMFGKVIFLKVQGLFNFHQYEKALEIIPIALDSNAGQDVLKLKNYEGVISGFLGEINKAKKIFKELIDEIEDIEFLIEVYLNIIWVYLNLDKNTTEEHKIEVAKKYLDLAKEHFNSVSNSLKWVILNNYSVYYYFLKNYEKAIEVLEDAITYCTQEDLPDIYINLAEIYMEFEKESINIKAKEYLDKAEILATKYNNDLALGYTFYTKAMVELSEDQLFKALDSLSLSYEYFKNAKAYVSVSDCVSKINELMNEYKLNNIKVLKESLQEKMDDLS